MEKVVNEGDFKMKKKEKTTTEPIVETDGVIKVDAKEVVEKVIEDDPIKVTITDEPKNDDVVVVNKDEATTDEPVIMEIVKDEPVKVELPSEKVVNATVPEGLEKLVDFMNDTNGTLEDFVRLNTDYSGVDNTTLLKEYYKSTRPLLDNDDIELIVEDLEHSDELDSETDIRWKKIAYKEEVAKAKKFLEETKDKYYTEIKSKQSATTVEPKQQEAIDFFNRYNEDQESAKQKHQEFVNDTNSLLTEEFKGFDFNLGEKTFRYGVKNPTEVAKKQSDISNFIGKFLDGDGRISDSKGYHKALYAGMNADTMAKHFYEQGRSDAIKESVATSKNITTEPRQTSSQSVFIKGIKAKAVTGSDSSKLRIKRTRN